MTRVQRDDIVGLLVLAVIVAAEAFVLRLIWNWHAVPVFHFKRLSYGHALGLVALLSAVLVTAKGGREGSVADGLTSALRVLAWLGLMLLAAWIGTQL